MKNFGFIRDEDKQCVYERSGERVIFFLLLYVDDILLIGNDIPTLNFVKAWLGNSFTMKYLIDLGD